MRRLRLFEIASKAVGGAEKLGDAIGITRRAVTYKLNNDRPLARADLLGAADAVEARANELLRLVAEMRGLD